MSRLTKYFPKRPLTYYGFLY